MIKNVKICISLFLAALLFATSFGVINARYALAADDVELVGKSSGLVLVPEGESF